VEQRAGQGPELLYGWHVGQFLDVDRAEAQPGGAQPWQQCDEVRPTTDQHGDAAVGVARPRLFDQLHDALRFAVVVAFELWVDLHGGGVARVTHGVGSDVGHGTGVRVVDRGEHAGEGVVEPRDQPGTRPEVGLQAQRFERHAAEHATRGLEEQRHLGLAKAVDRLHRVTDQEQRAAVSRRPSLGEVLEEFALQVGGVLELVDQQVPDAVVERQREVGWVTVGVDQRGDRSLPDLGEVDPPLAGEDQLQVQDSEQQQPGNGTEYGPLRIGVACHGQLARLVQALGEGRVVAQIVAERLDALLGTLATFGLLSGRLAFRREALAHRERPAPFTFLRQQQFGEPLPAWQVGGVGREHVALLEPRGQSTRIVAVLDSRRCGASRERSRLCDGRRIEAFGEALQAHHHLGVHRPFQTASKGLGGVVVVQMTQPLIALSEKFDHQVLEAVEVGVAMGDRAAHGIPVVAPHLEHRQRFTRRLAVERLGLLGQLRWAAEARQQRQLAAEPGAERVDGLDAQTLRAVTQPPPQLGIAGEHRAGQLAGGALVVVRGQSVAGRSGERAQHPLAHLGGRLACEGDGDDLLRGLDPRQQHQHALDQQRGLAGARRRLDDERGVWIERAGALCRVGYTDVSHRPLPPRRRRARAPCTAPRAHSNHTHRRPGRPRRCRRRGRSAAPRPPRPRQRWSPPHPRAFLDRAAAPPRPPFRCSHIPRRGPGRRRARRPGRRPAPRRRAAVAVPAGAPRPSR
jgi:hypothetical protein